MTAGDALPERLLRALAEELKLPLLQIARNAELNRSSDTQALDSIAYTADMAMRLIDGYLLSTHLHEQETLALEPVSISSILHDVAQKLQPLAQSYDQDIELSLGGRYEPVMANHEALEAAMVSLGYALIEAGGQVEKRGRVILGAHRVKDGIAAGVFGSAEGLSADMFKRAKALYGRSRQAVPAMNGGSGASVFIADALLGSMAAQLRVAHHHKLNGFAATLLPSQQLRLI